MNLVFWTRSIPTVIGYVPPLPGSMFAEAGVLTIWLPLIFETTPAGGTLTYLRLEHDPEKWKPVFRKDHAQTKRWDPDAI
jgi:hypothetical protein